MSDFNAEQAMTAHEKLCGERYQSIDRRIGGIQKILATAGMILVGLLSWSMKTQYETLQRQTDLAEASTRRSEVLLEAVHTVQGQVAEQVVPKLPK